MALKDFTYEMVVPNEDLPCKFFIFEGKNGNYRRANHWHQSVEIFLVLEEEDWLSRRIRLPEVGIHRIRFRKCDNGKVTAIDLKGRPFRKVFAMIDQDLVIRKRITAAHRRIEIFQETVLQCLVDLLI